MVLTLVNERLSQIPQLQNTRIELFEEALQLFDRLIELDPTNSHAYLQRGHTHEALRHPDEAVADYQKAIELDPRSHQAHYRVAIFLNGYAYFALGEYQAALDDIQRGIELSPQDGSTLTWVRFDTCPDKRVVSRFLEIVDGAVSLNNNATNLRATRGIVLAQLGEFERATADLAAVIAAGDASFQIYYHAALVALHLDDHHGYRALCEAMLEKFAATNTAEAATFAAWTSALAPGGLDNYEPSIALAGRALEMKPSEPLALQSLGAALLRAGQCDRALEQLMAAAETDPSHVTAMHVTPTCWRSRITTPVARKRRVHGWRRLISRRIRNYETPPDHPSGTGA